MSDLILSMQTAEDLARAYAHLERRRREFDEMFRQSTGRTPASVRDELRQFMLLEGIDEIIDGETGLGVRLGPSRRQTSWDTLGMAESVLLALRDLGLLDVRTALFDKWHKDSGSIATHEAQKWRIDGETQPPLQVVTGEGR